MINSKGFPPALGPRSELGQPGDLISSGAMFPLGNTPSPESLQAMLHVILSHPGSVILDCSSWWPPSPHQNHIFHVSRPNAGSRCQRRTVCVSSSKLCCLLPTTSSQRYWAAVATQFLTVTLPSTANQLPASQSPSFKAHSLSVPFSSQPAER